MEACFFVKNDIVSSRPLLLSQKLQKFSLQRLHSLKSALTYRGIRNLSGLIISTTEASFVQEWNLSSYYHWSCMTSGNLSSPVIENFMRDQNCCFGYLKTLKLKELLLVFKLLLLNYYYNLLQSTSRKVKITLAKCTSIKQLYKLRATYTIAQRSKHLNSPKN